MKFKTLMIIKAIVCLGFGPLLLFIPGFVLSLFGMEICDAASLTAREYAIGFSGTRCRPIKDQESDNLGSVYL